MIVDVIQKDRVKEQKLQFIRNHQQAFDVEPIYPLPLFEDFVMSVEGDCSLLLPQNVGRYCPKRIRKNEN